MLRRGRGILESRHFGLMRRARRGLLFWLRLLFRRREGDGHRLGRHFGLGLGLGRHLGRGLGCHFGFGCELFRIGRGLGRGLDCHRRLRRHQYPILVTVPAAAGGGAAVPGRGGLCGGGQQRCADGDR
ncbi:MAG: hypothetical protein B0D84_02435 [Candidatus Sedimenticola endophacoides]|uniref:Uncharacterized protein n=1 Tax=Candidatus Sedimenticola endophacoides TaxID=2548426 RepID=A0A657PPE7_9GAMM|nr:MAG: hypothetical protein B0D84_02435 [Candidatus Sedimenticola endophacoides]